MHLQHTVFTDKAYIISPEGTEALEKPEEIYTGTWKEKHSKS
jgi:hypothetical protein